VITTANNPSSRVAAYDRHQEGLPVRGLASIATSIGSRPAREARGLVFATDVQGREAEKRVTGTGWVAHGRMTIEALSPAPVRTSGGAQSARVVRASVIQKDGT
jgi:hypothetical protein